MKCEEKELSLTSSSEPHKDLIQNWIAKQVIKFMLSSFYSCTLKQTTPKFRRQVLTIQMNKHFFATVPLKEVLFIICKIVKCDIFKEFSFVS
jgi:hypothetical protein